MPTLSKELRTRLSSVTLAARELSERAAQAALEHLAVHEGDYRKHMGLEQRELRNRLRARGRALGDQRSASKGTQELRRLVELVAYENWHRMLFARFLTENHLLMSDAQNGSLPVTMEDCEELAPGLGAKDGFELACHFASQTLPGVFRSDDPALEVTLAPNDLVELRRLLGSLPAEVFRADDALGWTYQFWQATRKDEINKLGVKIGADELPAVTQLFTEDYMVEFLLHNTLGAWWAGKLGPIEADTQGAARARASLPSRDGVPAITWPYLRFVQDEGKNTWLPAAGIFPGWPTAARQVRVLDPSMGSGHFLVFALPILARLRMEEEGLSAAQAVVAALRDNLHGLEIDERCTQIAAFNLALTAWKLAGYQALPSLHLACCGLSPSAEEAEWVALAGPGKPNDRLQRGMARLHALFKDAPVLGGLINPRATGSDLLEADFRELQPILEGALAREAKDETTHEMAVTARGLAGTAELLAGHYTLVTTNVPYLARGKHDPLLRAYCERQHPASRTDLATCFLERCVAFSTVGGVSALVTPQNWLFQDAYRDLRRDLLDTEALRVVAKLGAGAFEGIAGEIVNVALVAITHAAPQAGATFVVIDASEIRTTEQKARALAGGTVSTLEQRGQLTNPDHRIAVDYSADTKPLSSYASYSNGLQTGDYPRFGRCFWELGESAREWNFFQTTIDATALRGGLHYTILWEAGRGALAAHPSSVVRGTDLPPDAGALVVTFRRVGCEALFSSEPLGTGFAGAPCSLDLKRP